MGRYHGVHQPITNPLGSKDGLVFEDQNKDVVLQPIEIMGTTEILNQSTTPTNLINLIDELFIGIMNTTMEFPTLQLHLLLDLKVLRSKQQNLLTRGTTKIEHPNSTPLFQVANGHNSLKRHRGLLESLSFDLNYFFLWSHILSNICFLS